MIASGAPVSVLNSMTTPWCEGSPLAKFEGKTLIALTPKPSGRATYRAITPKRPFLGGTQGALRRGGIFPPPPPRPTAPRMGSPAQPIVNGAPPPPAVTIRRGIVFALGADYQH